ncbi:MAG: hypothetical protein IPK60_20015 [Sandaracinaceae bacterium]|nr:hypothetical protein [Sandaracinaceae bacterium]
MPDFPVALRLADERVVVIGGDVEAAMKVARLVTTDAEVTVVAPAIVPRIRELVEAGRVRWHARVHQDSDLIGARFVVFALRDEAVAAELRWKSHAQGALFSAIDDPRNSDVSHVAIVEAGPIQIAIMSGGGAPSLIRRMREMMSADFDARFARFAAAIIQKRAQIRALPRSEQKAQLDAWLRGFTVKVALHFPPWFEKKDREGT